MVVLGILPDLLARMNRSFWCNLWEKKSSTPALSPEERKSGLH